MENQKLVLNTLNLGSVTLLTYEVHFLKELANVSSTIDDSKNKKNIASEMLKTKIKLESFEIQ